MIVPRMEFMLTIYSAKNVMETTLKKEEKIGGKKP